MEYMIAGGLALIILFAVVVSVVSAVSCVAAGVIDEEDED